MYHFCVCALTHNTLLLLFFFFLTYFSLQCFLTDWQKLFVCFFEFVDIGACGLTYAHDMAYAFMPCALGINRDNSYKQASEIAIKLGRCLHP